MRVTLSESWEEQAHEWAAWARAPGHDSYWKFHGERFLALLPSPGRLTLDIGCGEGRLSRDLRARGHQVVAVDSSPTLARMAAEADVCTEVVVADAADLPFGDASFDLACAFMSLMDMDDMPGAVQEAARVLEPGGRFCLAVVHPLNSAGRFAGETDESPFVLESSYFERRRYDDSIEREGLRMTFHSIHWTLEDYFRVLADAGLLVERLSEVTDESHPRWRRAPLFLHVRALKP